MSSYTSGLAEVSSFNTSFDSERFVHVNLLNFRFRNLPESSTIGPVTQSTEIFPTGRPARTSRFYVYLEEIV